MAASSPNKSPKVGSLLLDPKNARLPPDRRSEDQRELLHALLEHEDVKGLASSIAKLGLFPNERIVVIASGRRFIVLEGNRRLAAIRLLFNPELAPRDSLVKYYRKLSARANLAALTRLDVVLMPSRVAAAPIIAALHTGDAKKRWSSLQQARFYRELVDEGQTPEEIAEDVGVTLGQVRSYLRAEKLYRVALTLEYDDSVRAKIEDPRFPLTTLDRFLDSRLGRTFLGIELDESDGFRGAVHPDRFKAVLTHVAREVATKPGLTRDINKEEDWRAYIEKAKPLIPKTKMRGSFTVGVLLGDDAAESDDQDAHKKKAKVARRPPRLSTSVIPTGFVCTSRHDRVRAIFNEIKGMKIVTQRNATGVMLRVLIDIALWLFLVDQGHEKRVCDHFDGTRKKRKYDPNWTPPLRELISYSVEKRLFPGMTAAGYKSVRSLASKDAGYFLTVEGFNSFTHNPTVTPTEGDLRALWQRAEPMLEIILS